MPCSRSKSIMISSPPDPKDFNNVDQAGSFKLAMFRFGNTETTPGFQLFHSLIGHP